MAAEALTAPTLVLFLHLLGAALWVGGTLTLVVVNRVARRAVPDADAHRRLLRALGKGATPVLAAGFLLAALTGIELLRIRGYALSEIGTLGFWGSAFGTILGWKLAVVALSGLAAGAHGFLAAKGKLRGPVAAGLGTASALLGLLILYLGGALRWT